MKINYIIKSKNIFDSIEERPYEGLILIGGNKIKKIDRNIDNIEKYLKKEIEVLDFDDKLIMPGFHDSHVHLLMAAMYKENVNLINARSEEECVELLKNSTNLYESEKWLLGFSWYHVFWDKRELPSKKSLDKYFKKRPVFLLNAEAHGAWVNSKALEIAGIDKNTKDPDGGYIERDKNGEATGYLYENALGLVSKYAFDFNIEKEKELIKKFINGVIKYGITSINDMKPYIHGNIGLMETYYEMERNGELKIRINAAADLIRDIYEVEKWREKYNSDKFKVNLLKQFMDGVSTAHTALLLEEYEDKPGEYGIELNDLKEIRKNVLKAHQKDFCIRLHSCGDRSARLALDYYEEAQKKFGSKNCRHGIEHVEVIKESDIRRFGELEIIPSVQPEHIALTQIFEENPYPEVLGKKRADRTWPLKSLYESAGYLAIGSDCPVVDINPFLEIYRAVTRLHNDGKPEGGWNPSEKLSMYQILRSYTYGSAYGVCREEELGTLEPGKFADIIVLDKNLFEIEFKNILNTNVILTMVGGEVIYEK